MVLKEKLGEWTVSLSSCLEEEDGEEKEKARRLAGVMDRKAYSGEGSFREGEVQSLREIRLRNADLCEAVCLQFSVSNCTEARSSGEKGKPLEGLLFFPSLYQGKSAFLKHDD